LIKTASGSVTEECCQAWISDSVNIRSDSRSQVNCHDIYYVPHTIQSYAMNKTEVESVDSICRDSTDTQYMLIQTNFSKSPKQLTYKPL